MANQLIKGQHFNLMFHELVYEYLNRDYFYQAYDSDSQMSISAILYIIYTKLDIHSKIKDITKDESFSNKAIQSINQYLDEKVIRSSLIYYIPIATRPFIPLQEVIKTAVPLIRDFYNYSLEDLKMILISILRLNPCSKGTSFRV